MKTQASHTLSTDPTHAQAVGLGLRSAVRHNRDVARALYIALCVLLGISLALPCGAQQAEPMADPYLAAAVEALGAHDHQLALDLLDKAATRSADPRITYYAGYALEKLGRCDEARRKYQISAANGPPRFTEAANGALAGFDQRCVPRKPDVEKPQVVRQRGGTLKIVGWVLTTVGALTFAALPVKIAFDREIATQSEQYFEQVYECDVNFGELADDCDAEAIKSNPQWQTYDRRITTAKQSNVWMIAGGSALVASGIAMVIIGSTRRPAVALLPVPGGAVGTVSFRF